MTNKGIKAPTIMQQGSVAYENSLLLPYFATFLNAWGLGGIDRLISKHANDYALKKIHALIRELDKKIDKRIPEPGSDNFMAAMHVSINSLLETQSANKTKYFASVLACTWINSASSWDEVAQTLKLIRELEDIHMLILREALTLSKNGTDEAATFCIGTTGYESSTRIDEMLPNIDKMLLTSCISDLISKGLLNDSFTLEDGGMFAEASINNDPRPAPLAYSISELGCWFLNKIIETNSDESATKVATQQPQI